MPSDGEVDDGLTDWLGPHVVGHAVVVVTAAGAAVGVFCFFRSIYCARGRVLKLHIKAKIGRKQKQLDHMV